MDSCQLNSVVAPVAPAVPDTVTVTESTAQTGNTGHGFLVIANAFSLSLFAKASFPIPLLP